MEETSKQRLEDAYAEYIGSVKTFDDTYKMYANEVERLRRGGLLFRTFTWLIRRSAKEIETA